MPRLSSMERHRCAAVLSRVPLVVTWICRLDLARDIYHNATIEKIALIRFILEREKKKARYDEQLNQRIPVRFHAQCIFVRGSLRLGDKTIGPWYENFHGYVPLNFRTVDFRSEWQCQRRTCSWTFSLWVILLFSQTLSSLRIEIDNYIVQRQRAEENSVANVSFECRSIIFFIWY